jgi:hypothetical protein
VRAHLCPRAVQFALLRQGDSAFCSPVDAGHCVTGDTSIKQEVLFACFACFALLSRSRSRLLSPSRARSLALSLSIALARALSGSLSHDTQLMLISLSLFWNPPPSLVPSVWCPRPSCSVLQVQDATASGVLDSKTMCYMGWGGCGNTWSQKQAVLVTDWEGLWVSLEVRRISRLRGGRMRKKSRFNHVAFSSMGPIGLLSCIFFCARPQHFLLYAERRGGC